RIRPRWDSGQLFERPRKPGRGHDRQHPGRSRGWIREGMDRSPGHEGECPGPGLKRSLSNLNLQLALDDVERFFFALVDVRGRSRSVRWSRHFEEPVPEVRGATGGIGGVEVFEPRGGLLRGWSRLDRLRA